jgi:hypothetical protein
MRIIVWIYLNRLPNKNEPTKELVNKELFIFKQYQVDVKEIKCPLQ